MRLTFRQKGISLAAAFVMASLCAAPALAQNPPPKPEEGIPTQWMTAIRGGMGVNNSEGVAGLMWQSPAMGPSKYLRFRPAVQGAFASNVFAIGLVLDLVAEAKIPSSKWSLIFGGGVATGLRHSSCDECNATNSALTGHQMLLGFQHPSGFFGEIRATAGWNHGMELLAGYFFKGKK
jgi:hypothetical protein